MHKIEEILAALGVVGAPAAAAKTIEVAQKMDGDAKDHNVVTKTAEVDLTEMVKSLAVIVSEQAKSTSEVIAKIDGFQANIARIEETLVKAMKPVESGLQQSEPSEEQMSEIKKTQAQIDSSKSGIPKMTLSPSGVPMRPRVAIPSTMIGGK